MSLKGIHGIAWFGPDMETDQLVLVMPSNSPSSLPFILFLLCPACDDIYLLFSYRTPMGFFPIDSSSLGKVSASASIFMNILITIW